MQGACRDGEMKTELDLPNQQTVSGDSREVADARRAVKCSQTRLKLDS